MVKRLMANLKGPKGDPGPQGPEGPPGGGEGEGSQGPPGLSAYQVAVNNGFVGTESQWLASLHGTDGEDGANGAEGDQGPMGLSAYQVAVNNGFVGTEGQWLASLRGSDGSDGANGSNGFDGEPGLSAYQVAVLNGFVGLEADWLQSLVGPPGADGQDGSSAYQVAVDNGFVGTENEWLDSLKGEKGDSGDPLTVTWESLDKPPVIAAGSTASEARSEIEAVGTSDSRLSDTRVPTDESVTNVKVADNADINADKLIDGSTKKLLTLSERKKLASVVNATDFGVVGDGVADDTDALNSAAASISPTSNACLVIPSGTYKITDMVTIGCSVDASEATFRYTGTGTALLVGTDVFAAVVSRKRFNLPRVICASRPALLWDGSSRGIVLSNLNDCVVDVPFVQDFEEGLIVYGKGQGSAYCQIHLGSLWNNHRQLILDCDETGWSNQNVFIGGRMQQILERGATADDANANQILIGRNGSRPGQNTFIGTSVEGDNPSYYKLDCEGRFNTFINCRWEKFTGACRVRWGANAFANVIERGYDSHLIDEIYVSGCANNEVQTRYGSYIEATNISGQSIPNGGGTTPFMTITGWTSVHQRSSFNGDSLWTPRQGRWRISANVSVKDTTGNILVQAVAGGSRIIDAASRTAEPSGATMLKLSGTAYFNGAESLILRIRQDATLNRQLTTTAGYVELRAEYAGPA